MPWFLEQWQYGKLHLRQWRQAGWLGLRAADALLWSLHMPLCSSAAGIKVFGYPLCGHIRAPFEVTVSDCLNSVEMRGLQRDWCANPMLLALVCTVCVKHAMGVGRWAWALARSRSANGIRSLTRWVVMSMDLRGRGQRSILGSLSPLKIIFPLYRTVHLCLSNVTL